MNNLFALAAGLLFGFGLAASGMTNTQKVLGFLDVSGAWDPDLLFVMAAALFTTLIGFSLLLKRERPFFSDIFALPTNTKIDVKLVVGALIFGVGWGVYGYCPGPAIAALSYLQTNTFLFILTMIIGMVAVDVIERLINKRST